MSGPSPNMFTPTSPEAYNTGMRILGSIWGVAGILAVIAYAVVGLAARALSINSYELMWYHWAALVFGTLILIYAKSYRGFLLRLAPGIALRARAIRARPTTARVIFAPFYCMGFFGSGRRTQVRMVSITLAMVALIIVVRNLLEPWRAILDFGIAVALTLGFCFILIESLRHKTRNQATRHSRNPGATQR